MSFFALKTGGGILYGFSAIFLVGQGFKPLSQLR